MKSNIKVQKALHPNPDAPALSNPDLPNDQWGARFHYQQNITWFCIFPFPCQPFLPNQKLQTLPLHPKATVLDTLPQCALASLNSFNRPSGIFVPSLQAVSKGWFFPWFKRVIASHRSEIATSPVIHRLHPKALNLPIHQGSDATHESLVLFTQRSLSASNGTKVSIYIGKKQKPVSISKVC